MAYCCLLATVKHACNKFVFTAKSVSFPVVFNIYTKLSVISN